MQDRRRQVVNARAHYGSEAMVRHYSADRGLFPKEIAAIEFIPQGSKILDLGCGAGRTTQFLRTKSNDLVALDVAYTMVRAARETFPDVPFLTGDASCLCFHDDAFDVVIFSFNGLDNLYPLDRRRAALDEVRRVLKPGGIFIFSAHNHSIPRGRDGILPFLASMCRKERSTYIGEKSGARGLINTYLTTPTAQIRELSNAGFELIELIPRRLLRKVKSMALIGLLDPWVYYVCRRLPK